MKRFFKLRVRMLEKDYTAKSLGAAIGRSGAHVAEFLRGVTGMDSRDIAKVARVLDIPPEEIGEYFFPELEKKHPQLQLKGRGTAV